MDGRTHRSKLKTLIPQQLPKLRLVVKLSSKHSIPAQPYIIYAYAPSFAPDDIRFEGCEDQQFFFILFFNFSRNEATL